MKEIALKYLKAGISVIPIHGDGSKSPAVASWHPFTKALANREVVEKWFSDTSKIRGIAAVCGGISGGLVVIDFDEKDFYKRWLGRVGDAVHDVLEQTCIVESPRGFHVWLRSGEVHRGAKLARVPLKGDKGGFKTVIETRGERNYVLLPGCPPECHPDHKEYRFVDGVEFTNLKIMKEDDVEILLNVARSFNEWRAPGKLQTGFEKLPPGDERPGTHYCKDGGWEAWTKLLESHQWSLLRTTSNDRQIWKRPGKRDRGGSATLGFVVTELGPELYVFSSNAEPFDQDRCYSLFSARAILDFGSDYKRCSAALANEGYGRQPNDKYLKLVEDAIGELRDKVEAGESPLRAGYLEEALNDGKFKALWKRRRQDFNLDNQRYDMALLFHALSFGPLETCMPTALALLYEFYKLYEKTTERAFDRDYIARKVMFIDENKERKPMDQIVEDFQAGERGDDGDRNLTWLRSVIYAQYDGMIQYGNDLETASFAMCAVGEREIRIGPASTLFDADKFAQALYVNGRLRDFNGYQDPRFYRKAHWRSAVDAMFKTMTYRNEDVSRQHRFAELLAEYLTSGTMFSEESEEGWEAALPTKAPFQLKLRFYVNADSFCRWVNEAKNELYKVHDLSHFFLKNGWEKERISGDYGGRRVRPWYWWMAQETARVVLGVGGNGSKPERVPF